MFARSSFQITGAINLTVGYNRCVESLPVGYAHP